MTKQKKYKLPDDPALRQLIRDQLAGYKVMNEFVQQEQRRNLPKMTPEESKEIYIELLKIWEHSQKQNHDMGNLDRLRIQELVERRRLFDKIAEGLTKKC
ncbi:MAG: hypothetical protein ACE5JB_12950 [bacterium]